MVGVIRVIESRPAANAVTERTGIGAASVGLAVRSVRNITRLPSAFLPSVLMPIFQTIAFSGTFFAIVSFALGAILVGGALLFRHEVRKHEYLGG